MDVRFRSGLVREGDRIGCHWVVAQKATTPKAAREITSFREEPGVAPERALTEYERIPCSTKGLLVSSSLTRELDAMSPGGLDCCVGP